MEWLSTGQMIDQLKVGEVAESSRHNLRVFKTEDGRIHNQNRIDGHLVMSFHTTDTLWHILPKYVSREEALLAFTKGKLVRAENEELNLCFEYQLIDGGFAYRNVKRGDEHMIFPSKNSGIGINGAAIQSGKWSILD